MRYQLKALSLLILLITILKASNGNFNDSRNFFMPRVTNNNLRGRGLNVSQPYYNNRFMDNFFLILLPMCGIICLSLLNLLPLSSNLGY